MNAPDDQRAAFALLDQAIEACFAIGGPNKWDTSRRRAGHRRTAHRVVDHWFVGGVHVLVLCAWVDLDVSSACAVVLTCDNAGPFSGGPHRHMGYVDDTPKPAPHPMNRAERRAAARNPDPRICEHGHPKKTDGNGDPMCPHGCGFVDKPVKRHRCCGNAASGQHRPTCPRRPTKRLRRRRTSTQGG